MALCWRYVTLEQHATFRPTWPTTKEVQHGWPQRYLKASMSGIPSSWRALDTCPVSCFLTQKCSHVSSYCMTCRKTLSITSIKWSCPHHCMCSFLRPTLFCHLSPHRQLSAPSIEALSLDSSAAALLSCFIDGCLPSIVRRWMGWCWWLYFP